MGRLGGGEGRGQGNTGTLVSADHSRPSLRAPGPTRAPCQVSEHTRHCLLRQHQSSDAQDLGPCLTGHGPRGLWKERAVGWAGSRANRVIIVIFTFLEIRAYICFL